MIYCPDCRFRIVSNLRSGASYCAYYNSPNETILGCESGESKIITNADRIRAMSDEELAKTISGEEIYPWCTKPCEYDNCTDCVLAWLKQEAET